MADDLRDRIARALFIASDDFAFADRMAKAWDAPGPHGRQRWWNYADAVIAELGLTEEVRTPEFHSHFDVVAGLLHERRYVTKWERVDR